jgi:hypothetical protein
LQEARRLRVKTHKIMAMVVAENKDNVGRNLLLPDRLRRPSHQPKNDQDAGGAAETAEGIHDP